MKNHPLTPAAPLVEIPVSIARSALFSVKKPGGDRLENVQFPIAPQRGARLRYSGPPLTQQHSLVWQAVIQSAKARGVHDDQPFLVSSDDLLRALGGKGGDSKQRARLDGWLADLATGWIDYETERQGYSGPLLMAASRCMATGKQSLRIPIGVADLLRGEVLRNDLGRKASFGQNSLALWLHDYLATHLRPPPVPVSLLRELSGSSLDLAHFRHRLRRALSLLAAGPNPLVLAWTLDGRDALHVQKAPTGVNILGRGVIPGAAPRRRVDVARAREQRAGLNL